LFSIAASQAFDLADKLRTETYHSHSAFGTWGSEWRREVIFMLFGHVRVTPGTAVRITSLNYRVSVMEVPMEYRGVDYSVARADPPSGWRWSVACEDSKRAGTHASREGAMLHAERFIDEVMAHRKRLVRQRNQI
jgi:hypothetical protein